MLYLVSCTKGHVQIYSMEELKLVGNVWEGEVDWSWKQQGVTSALLYIRVNKDCAHINKDILLGSWMCVHASDLRAEPGGHTFVHLIACVGQGHSQVQV